MKKEFNLSDYVFNPNNDDYQAISLVYVKQFLKEILEEIENLDLKMAKEVMENEKTNSFDDFSEFAQGEVVARRRFAMDIKKIIKQKAGDKLI